MLARALLASALALLVSGDAARLGWEAVGRWHFVFPYLWLFVLLESTRARRRVEDGGVFLAGAAMAMLYGGVYAKDLQHGSHPLGVDWLGAVCAAFDGGMTTVLAMHAAERLRPRRDEEPPEMGLLVMMFLIFGLGAAAAVYGVKTAFNFYRADRLLGSTWLLSDILFGWLAWKLFSLARARSESEEEIEAGRADWVWALSAFAVWLPGARLIARVCAASDLPGAILYFFVGAWTVGAVWLFRQLWRERGHHESVLVSGSRPALISAGWRAAGALLLVVTLGSDLSDARTEGIFSAAIDWPTRALFAWAFLTSRLKV